MGLRGLSLSKRRRAPFDRLRVHAPVSEAPQGDPPRSEPWRAKQSNIRRGASLGERSNQTSAAERALASEAIRHGQTRELGNAQSATDPQRRVLSDADALLAGRTTPALAGSGVGCGIAGRMRPVPTQSDAASWPSPHMSNSHSFRGPPPFPCPSNVCAHSGRVNGVCRM